MKRIQESSSRHSVKRRRLTSAVACASLLASVPACSMKASEYEKDHSTVINTRQEHSLTRQAKSLAQSVLAAYLQAPSCDETAKSDETCKVENSGSNIDFQLQYGSPHEDISSVSFYTETTQGRTKLHVSGYKSGRAENELVFSNPESVPSKHDASAALGFLADTATQVVRVWTYDTAIASEKSYKINNHHRLIYTGDLVEYVPDMVKGAHDTLKAMTLP